MDLLTRLRAQPLPFAALLGIELLSAEPEKIGPAATWIEPTLPS